MQRTKRPRLDDSDDEPSLLAGSVLPKAVNVRRPHLSTGTAPYELPAGSGDSTKKLEKMLGHLWDTVLVEADVFLSTHTLGYWQSRTKNTDNLHIAQQVADKLASEDPIILTTIIIDDTSEILFIYLGFREKQAGPRPRVISRQGTPQQVQHRIAESLLSRAKPISQISQGRTQLGDIEGYHYDGFMEELSNHILYETQCYLADNQPHYNARDGRHNLVEQHGIHYPFADPTPLRPDLQGDPRLQVVHTAHTPAPIEEDRPRARKKYLTAHSQPGPAIPHAEYNLQIVYERTGTKHLVQAWSQQATATGDLLEPSKDMAPGTTSALMALNTYYLRAQVYTRLVGVCCKIFYPAWHAVYEQTFNAGKSNLLDPGPFLGRVIVWKLQVDLHRDGLDVGPTLTSADGSFEGGAMVLPDFGAKFSYKCGHIGFGYYGALYHCVEPWEPAPAPEHLAKYGVTSGRMSTVFFSPKKSLDVLKDKAQLWLVNTRGNLNPEMKAAEPVHRGR
ncbi:hypothetical protein C8F01DRAFT_664885 [Mycena amicta]|nr:hypothetical protein C8F01DRAFT_664885 [Mycena amicta]